MSLSSPELMVNIILCRWLLLKWSGYQPNGNSNLFLCYVRSLRSWGTSVMHSLMFFQNKYLLQMFSKRSRKDFWKIANDVWTNYSMVCTPERHNLEQSQTYNRSPRRRRNLNELLHFFPIWGGGSGALNNPCVLKPRKYSPLEFIL